LPLVLASTRPPSSSPTCSPRPTFSLKTS
jgi:hypothetical protein